MAYTTQSNIINAIGRKTLQQLTDDNGTGEVDVEVVNYNIDKAQKEIDSYVRGRYPADMEDADVPAEITSMCTDLTVYYLYKRRLQLTMPDAVMSDYKHALTRLEKIQAGKITPYEQENEPVVIITNKTSSSRTFNDAMWSHY